MNEQLIQYQTAILAKEKGFDIPVWDFIDTYGDINSLMGYIGDSFQEKYDMAKEFVDIYLPTQSLLQKWLREVHDIYIDILEYYDEKDLPLYDKKFPKPIGFFCWDKYDDNFCEEGAEKFKTYEEALEAGLFEALKLI